jgi:hypothetical protein
MQRDIEWSIEDQAFLRSYDLTPHPPPSPSPDSKSTGETHEDREQDNLLTEEWEGAKSYDVEKARPSIWSFNTLWELSMEHCGMDHGYLLFLERAKHEPGGKRKQ